MGGWGCKEDLGEAGIGENVIRLYSMKKYIFKIKKKFKMKLPWPFENFKTKKKN